MTRSCPGCPGCPGCRADSSAIVRDGTFFRYCDSRRVPRFKCTACDRSFNYNADKRRHGLRRRRLLPLIQPLLRSGLSQRRMASVLKVSRTTLVRYIVLVSEEARERHKLFASMTDLIASDARVKTDEHQRYPELIKTHLPNATHKQYKSIRGCITGQGELKKTRFDQLFSINHTLAMLRANINRLVHRTWCTTKCNDRLFDHIALYVEYHNSELLKPGNQYTKQSESDSTKVAQGS